MSPRGPRRRQRAERERGGTRAAPTRYRMCEKLLTVGDDFDHEYSMTRDGATVATVSKRWLRVRDTYGVEVALGEDDALVLAVSAAVDPI